MIVDSMCPSLEYLHLQPVQIPFLLDVALQKLELEMKGQNDAVTKEQIGLRKDLKKATDGLADPLIALENIIYQLERSRATICSMLEMAERFTNDLGTPRHNVNQLMETRNVIGTRVGLCFTRVADRHGKVEVHMATVLGNAQLLNSRICPEKGVMTKVSFVTYYNDDASISSDEHFEHSEIE